MMRYTPAHWIKPNESVRLPHRHVVLDTEARSTHQGPDEVQTWRLGVAAYAHRSNRGHWHTDQARYETPEALWADVVAFCRPRRRTVLWAHNLAYDLRISRAFEILPKLGMALVDVKVTDYAMWARFADGETTLLCVDSMSVWPVPLERLGGSVGLGKPPLPQGDNPRAWWRRCEADVAILSTAVLAWVDWLREDDVGSWQVSGAGQGWAHWRHRHYTHKVLADPQWPGRSAERRALWAGRREAWAWGENTSSLAYCLDWENAYPRIAAEVEVPVKPYSVSRGLRFDRLLEMTDRFAVLAEVRVVTDQPVVPCEVGGRIVWPVGQFDTVLWDPELALLAQAGATVTVGKIWLYRKAPALQQWAQWITEHLRCGDHCHPPLVKLALKNWSRAVIGRFAMRHTVWEPEGTVETDRIQLQTLHDIDGAPVGRMLQVGHAMFLADSEQEWANAAPMVTGYIQSVARAKLWQAAQAIGPEHVLYVDTDSITVTAKGKKEADRHRAEPLFAGLRSKRSFRGWTIVGPGVAVWGGEPSISGVPRGARLVGKGTWEGEVWRGVTTSLHHGEAGSVRVRTRRFHLRNVDRRRVRGRDGRTRPLRLPARSPPANRREKVAA